MKLGDRDAMLEDRATLWPPLYPDCDVYPEEVAVRTSGLQSESCALIEAAVHNVRDLSVILHWALAYLSE